MSQQELGQILLEKNCFAVMLQTFDQQIYTSCTFVGRGLTSTSVLSSHPGDHKTPAGEQAMGENKISWRASPP